MALLNVAVLFADSQQIESPLRTITLGYPCVYEAGIKKACGNYIEPLMGPNDNFEDFRFLDTEFLVKNFCSDEKEIHLFIRKIERIFKIKLQGDFINLFDYNFGYEKYLLDKALDTNDFVEIFYFLNKRLGPLV